MTEIELIKKISKIIENKKFIILRNIN